MGDAGGESVKIVQTDNFNRDDVSDTLVAENVPPYYAEKIVKFLNDTLGGERSSAYFQVKPDEYKLYVFDPR